MKKIFLRLLFCILFFSEQLNAQESLPNFSLKNAGNNRIIISWVNNYQVVKQISIQRSFDSLTGYKTILSVPAPMTKQNGYVDTKAPNDHMFYRLFIMLDGAQFIFSRPRRALSDSTILAAEDSKTIDPFSTDINKPAKLDSVITNENNKSNVFVPSNYVYTSRDGNLHLNLPHADSVKYFVKFYDESDRFLFEIRNIKDSALIVDKTNFYHAGWFKFELFINDKLKEKHKFFLEKEF